MTKIPQEIIAKAVEGGWQQKYTFDEVIALDKNFWQALGKALGWREHKQPCQCLECHWNKKDGWNNYAHRFYNLILNEQETDSFWQNLLNV